LILQIELKLALPDGFWCLLAPKLPAKEKAATTIHQYSRKNHKKISYNTPTKTATSKSHPLEAFDIALAFVIP
jgi:hypothetical protein